METADISFSEQVRAARLSAGLSQRELASAAGVSYDTIVSWEGSRRHLPKDPDRVRAVGRATGLDKAAADALLNAAGHGTERNGLLKLFEESRRPLKTAAGWIHAYPWPCLVVNERREFVAWNEAANAVAEMDLGERLPTPEDRNMLWMAALPWFRERLTNWDELVGSMISTLKADGLGDPASPSVTWVNALLGRIGSTYPEVLGKVGALYATVPIWNDGDRNMHPATWRLSTGQELAFRLVFREWSIFDGLFTVDWHPINAETCEWLNSRPRGPEPDLHIREQPWFEELRSARERLGLSRPELHALAAVPASSIYAYERNRRRPRKAVLLRLARALSLPSGVLNGMLDELGYTREHSDFARLLLGEPAAMGHAYEHPDLGRDSYDRTLDSVNKVPWPMVILGGRCEVVAGNGLMRRLVDWQEFEPLDSFEHPHLFQLLFSDRFREACRNWPELMEHVIPGSVVPLVRGRDAREAKTSLLDVFRQIKKLHPEAVRTWHARARDAESDVQPRVATKIHYVTPDGTQLAFHCLTDTASIYFPVSTLDLIPADGATWRWAERYSVGD